MVEDRPLYWVKGIGRQDVGTVESSLTDLFQEGPSVLAATEDIGFECVKRLTARNSVVRDDEAVVVLTGMFLDAASTSRILIQQGRTKACCSQIRIMIESHLLAEYLRGHAERADEWGRAGSSKERRAFSFDSIYQQLPDSGFWKKWWDELNEVVHSNRGAAPTQYRIRPIFGIDMYIGGYFDPIPQSRLFLETLALCLSHIEKLRKWYGQELDTNLISQARDTAQKFPLLAADLQARARDAWIRVRDEPGTISLQEQERAVVQMGLPAGTRQPDAWLDPFDLPLVPPTDV
ncbi:MAG: hypothetical protein IID41_12540 [Planctomycetes bacterium]|nr:hypothetical protein [Planctomycetota bacterium]